MKNMNKGHSHQPRGHQEKSSGAAASLVPLSDEAIASLSFMIEEEKMAGDLYEAFYDQTNLSVFSRIAASEDRHMDALLKQADLIGVDASALTELPAGQYNDPALQALYDALYTAGSASTEAALYVGQQVEQADIADLNLALGEAAGTSLVGVYTNLLNGSENHLATFDMWLA
jgi:hypothetical protein